MDSKRLKKYLQAIDLHSNKNRKMVVYVCFGLLALLSVYVRGSLIHFQNPDYQLFGGWYDFLKAHGIHSFTYDFSVYNPPITYFLYVATLLPLSKIVAIKGIMAFFDIILAVSVYFVVKIFRPGGYVPLIAALSTMFLPTVLITGVFWGQFDQLYTAAILFSLYAGLRDNSKWAWIWFGIAIAIKFQAIFFLPVLGVMIFKRIRWYDAVWGAGSFLLLTLPPMLAGRSFSSLLNIYPAQAHIFNGYLTLNAPNIYQWVPNSAFPYLNKMGIGVALAACIFVVLNSILRERFSKKDLLLCTVLVLYLIPFLLPAMHERYFFAAGITSMVLAFAYPFTVYAGIAVLMQAITLFSYSPFLFNKKPIPLTALSLFVLLIICILTAKYLGLVKENLLGKPPAKPSIS